MNNNQIIHQHQHLLLILIVHHLIVEPMLQNKSLATIIDLDEELYPFAEAFPVLVALIQRAITIQYL
jgi:hypothetical protein